MGAVKFVRIDPPGSWCQHDAALQLIRGAGGTTFLDVGCGAAALSARLCAQGWRGVGVDVSVEAVAQARTVLRNYIDDGRYRLIAGDIFDLDLGDEQVDVGLSLMVMEHVEDDVGFVRRMAGCVKPSGHVVVGVPGRRDRWNIEDETVGHLRRYDRDDLHDTLVAAGLSEVTVWSCSVPVANLLFHVGNHAIRRSAEVAKLGQPARVQTETSGIRDIPWKTTFPPLFRFILNPVALSPLFGLQRLFYRSNLGLTMIGRGRVTEAPFAPRAAANPRPATAPRRG
jgi:SAM-dependent methyltransferase